MPPTFDETPAMTQNMRGRRPMVLQSSAICRRRTDHDAENRALVEAGLDGFTARNPMLALDDR